MRRLLVYTENYHRGGGNRYLVDAVNAAAPLFDDVRVYSNPGGLFPEDLTRLSAPHSCETVGICVRVPPAGAPSPLRLALHRMTKLLEPLHLLRNTARFMRLIEKERPALVLSCNGGYPGALSTLAMALAARLKGVPVLLSIVSVPMRRKPLLLPYHAMLDAVTWWACAGVLVNARAIADELAGARRAPQEKIHVAYNGLERRASPPAPAGRRSEIVVGCVCRMDYAKGVLDLVDAFRTLCPRHPRLRLLLVGDGDASAEISRRIAQERLEERVTVTGYHEGDIDELLGKIDIYVFPSLHEGFPYSVLEAMRAGRAIVATAVGGIPEAVRDGEEALLVEAGSPSAIAEAVERLVNDEGLARRLGGNAGKRFVERFSLEPMGARVREIVGTLSGERSQA